MKSVRILTFSAPDFPAFGLNTERYEALLEKRFHRRCFPGNIGEFLGTTFLKNICEQLLLLLLTWENQHTLLFCSGLYAGWVVLNLELQKKIFCLL